MAALRQHSHSSVRRIRSNWLEASSQGAATRLHLLVHLTGYHQPPIRSPSKSLLACISSAGGGAHLASAADALAPKALPELPASPCETEYDGASGGGTGAFGAGGGGAGGLGVGGGSEGEDSRPGLTKTRIGSL